MDNNREYRIAVNGGPLRTSNYTAGPWETIDGAEVYPTSGAKSYCPLARVEGPWSGSTLYVDAREARANGRLIAAAPELAASLRDCVVWLESMPLSEEPSKSVAAAKALLKKIKGGA
jgi:hypothetical protein